MSAEAIETTAVVLSENNSLPVTRVDLNALTEKLAVLKDFVKSQLKEGIDNDYAVIPGTARDGKPGKKVLLKPGAEKLMLLFGLRSEVTKVMEIIDHNGNFAMFAYKASVYHIRSGNKIAECDAVCNSQEKKYATRSTWIKNAAGVNEKVPENTPIYDIMNTLMKMCQKRAIVGAVILATGASDFFTQDIDDADDAKTNGVIPGGSIGTPSSNGDASKPIVITGNTVPIKEDIKKAGGSWDRNEKVWRVEKPTKELIDLLESSDGVTYK